MKRINIKKAFSIRVAFGLLAILTLVNFVSAQTKLRDALDYDGDDKADYSVFRNGNSTWYVANSSGSFIFQQWGIFDYDTVTPGDYDGDGKGDYAVWRYNNRVWYILNSSNNTLSAATFGLVGDTPMARDYDGDGKTDIAITRRTNGSLVWYILGSTSGFYARQFGLSNDSESPGDYDGDGKFDIAVHRQGSVAGSQAFYYIWRSSDSVVISYPWGVYGDTVVPGDYDGDGKTDAAIMRRNSPDLTWYILRSSDGGFVAQNFGLKETDFPTQNDYDGDGKTDLSIWRETEGIFYKFNSSNLTITGVTWGLISDFPVASYDSH